ncbi:MAG: caspase family protein [Candidatus Manganitrophus sp. SB1]|nr:caspase family protein [Candidatus Manganitrophus morganii]
MNIAILIGVSQYKVAAPLPACAADVEQMRRLLTATNKYDDICCLTAQTSSGPLKEALRGFFAKYQSGAEIGEALIYFSGHGVYHADALFCCSDFDPNRPATTSISNEELDDLLRSVKPIVAVKVIDACQSGSPYIKDASAGFEKALRTSRLSSFICMASSRQDQSSYASVNASAFTAKWIDAALDKQSGTVLYRDIQAVLADAFVNNPDQTPFFVTQGTGLEIFAAVTEEMRKIVTERSKSSTVATPQDTVVDVISAEVARLDNAYVSLEEACRAIEQAGQDLASEPISDPLVSHFYEKRISQDGKLVTLPRIRAVANFAAEQGWAKKYFVRVIQEQYRERVPKEPFKVWGAGILSTHLASNLGDEDYVLQTRSRPGRLESTQTLPFEVAEVVFEAKKHPALKAFSLYIGIVHSLTEVMVLSAIVQFIQIGWSERSPQLSDVQWKYQSFPWKDVVSQPKLLWQEVLDRSQDTIKAYLEGLIPKKEDSQAKVSTNDQKTSPHQQKA